MRPRQREGRCIVVKNIGGIAGRVAGQASRAVVRVAAYASVFIVRLRVCMAGRASEFSIVRRVRVAFQALAPFPIVRPAVNGEILRIVVISS